MVRIYRSNYINTKCIISKYFDKNNEFIYPEHPNDFEINIINKHVKKFNFQIEFIFNIIKNNMKLSKLEYNIDYYIKIYEKKIIESNSDSLIKKYTQKITRLKDSFKDNTCSICLDNVSNPIILICCDKIICEECIKSWFDTKRYMAKRCPYCREKLSKNILNYLMEKTISSDFINQIPFIKNPEKYIDINDDGLFENLANYMYDNFDNNNKLIYERVFNKINDITNKKLFHKMNDDCITYWRFNILFKYMDILNKNQKFNPEDYLNFTEDILDIIDKFYDPKINLDYPFYYVHNKRLYLYPVSFRAKDNFVISKIKDDLYEDNEWEFHYMFTNGKKYTLTSYDKEKDERIFLSNIKNQSTLKYDKFILGNNYDRFDD